MKKILFYTILLANTFQIACSQNNGQVSVEQVPSKYSTILYANTKENKIISVRFYLTFEITNNTNEEISIGIPEYINHGKFLKDLFKGWITIIPVYFEQNEHLEYVLSNKEIEGLDKLEKTPKKYVFLTRHELSADPSVQSLFSTYLDKMKRESKDTLHIGTISELKENNSPILQLLEGDSIIITFDKKDLYMDPIPVHIK